jgi:hypothetical protein
LAAAALAAGASPARWKLADGGNGHLYDAVVVDSTLSWDEARAAAQALGTGWDLATVTSAAESSFVEALFANSTAFEWVTGEPVTFTDRGPNEPFGNGQAISYADFSAPFGDGGAIGWNDIGPAARPDGPIAFIAEVPEARSATLMLAGIALLMVAVRRRRQSPPPARDPRVEAARERDGVHA